MTKRASNDNNSNANAKRGNHFLSTAWPGHESSAANISLFGFELFNLTVTD
jgi:hypothetical protein